MKKLLTILLFLAAPALQAAQTCADTALFSWNSNGQAIPADIDGYSLRVDGVEEYNGTNTSVSTGAMTGVTWTAGQTYTFDLRAYKGTTFSNPTTSVRLLDKDDNVISEAAAQECSFVTAVPTQPDTPSLGNLP